MRKFITAFALVLGLALSPATSMAEGMCLTVDQAKAQLTKQAATSVFMDVDGKTVLEIAKRGAITIPATAAAKVNSGLLAMPSAEAKSVTVLAFSVEGCFMGSFAVPTAAVARK